MNQRGFGDIGYHYLIDPAGRVWAGRSLDYQGAHARGSNNIANIGICLLGNFDDERPRPTALRSLASLLGALRERHDIPAFRVYGHCDFCVTACPGRHLSSWVGRYKGGLLSASQ